MSQKRSYFCLVGALLVLVQPNHAGWGPVSLFGGNKLPNLENQVKQERLGLERQVRQYQDEMGQLRHQIKILQFANAKLRDDAQQASAVDWDEEIEQLKGEIDRMTREIEKMEEIQNELEQMLTAEKKSVEQYKARLKETNADKNALKAQHEQELSDLRKQFEATMASKLDELKDMMETQMEDALADQRKQLKAEKEEAVKNVEVRVRKEMDQRIKEEQAKAKEAIGREKTKMRKLVKALAEREKQLIDQTKKGNTRFGGVENTSSGKSLNLKAESVRGSLK